MLRRTRVVTAGVVAVGVTLGVLALALPRGAGPAHNGSVSDRAGADISPPLSGGEVDALPEARYDAVIGGLIPFAGSAADVIGRFRIDGDVALYGSDHRRPVARMAAKDFVGAPTTIVAVERSGPWTLVMTPARVTLPSRSQGPAPAQSAAWVRTAQLRSDGVLPDRIEVSTGRQTLTIRRGDSTVASFPVGVGTPGTPTPTGVTGYLQQRYLDPAQGETVFPIQLTSLHATTQDEPYQGADGGLIGIHYNEVSTGAVSHGCIRLSGDAIRALDTLPLGTPISITA